MGRIALGLPVALAPRVAGSAASGAFSPASLFSGGQLGLWAATDDNAKMWQDDAGTMAVTGTGQPVGKILDQSGNGRYLRQATSAARGLLTTFNGKQGLKLDGVDDGIYSDSGMTWAGPSDIFLVVANPDADATAVLMNAAAAYGDPYIFGAVDGNGAAHSLVAGTTLVNGVQLTGAGGLGSCDEMHDAIGSTQIKVLEHRGVDLSAFGTVGFGGYTTFNAAHVYFEWLICPAQTADVRDQIRSYLTTKWGAA